MIASSRRALALRLGLVAFTGVAGLAGPLAAAAAPPLAGAAGPPVAAAPAAPAPPAPERARNADQVDALLAAIEHTPDAARQADLWARAAALATDDLALHLAFLDRASALLAPAAAAPTAGEGPAECAHLLQYVDAAGGRADACMVAAEQVAARPAVKYDLGRLDLAGDLLLFALDRTGTAGLGLSGRLPANCSLFTIARGDGGLVATRTAGWYTSNQPVPLGYDGLSWPAANLCDRYTQRYDGKLCAAWGCIQ
jgi:hypothetical protein